MSHPDELDAGFEALRARAEALTPAERGQLAREVDTAVLGHACYEQGLAKLADGQFTEAKRLLRAAANHGTPVHWPTLAKLVPAHRVAAARAAQRSPLDLTAREAEIARLASQGHTNRAIAQRLFISVRAVEVHISRIFHKLGVSSRTALAALLARSR